MQSMEISRRELMAGVVGLAVGRTFAAAKPPTSPVAIARCTSYGKEMYQVLSHLMDQVGGIRKLVKGKTIAVKLNLTGNPERFPERPDINPSIRFKLPKQPVVVRRSV